MKKQKTIEEEKKILWDMRELYFKEIFRMTNLIIKQEKKVERILE